MMHNNSYYEYYCSTDPYNSSYNGFEPASLSSASYVDCTLSLGTPSTRSTEIKKQSCRKRWWGLGSKHSAGDSEPEVAMRCCNCGTSSTPLWRKGPNGPKSLCNACGIRYKKEERRRATALESRQASSERYYTSNYDHHENGAVSSLSWMLSVNDRS